MALEDILNSIQTSAEKRMKEIASEGEKNLEASTKEWDCRLSARKEEILSRARVEINMKIQAAELKLKSVAQDKLLQIKQEVMNRVFATSLDQLASLSDKQYVSLMSDLITALPNLEGSVVSVKGKESLLKNALKQSGRKISLSSETLEGSGGFVFQSKDIQVDNTFEALVEQEKDDTRVDIGQILFN